ncbi:hypothetical protein MTO96_040874, partial [Rhipicephalus appendiculatus]
MKLLLSQAILSAVAPHGRGATHLTQELRNCHGPEISSNEAFNTLSEFSKRYEEYCAQKIAPQMSVSELHVHRCADKQFNRMFYRCWADMLSADYTL